MGRQRKILIGASIVVIGLTGCYIAGCCATAHGPKKSGEKSALPTTQPTTAPDQVTPTVQFQSKEHGLAFQYPGTWHPASDDTVVTLVPASETAIGTHTLAVDEPALPPHIPGFIPLGAVAKGFVDDLRSRYKGVHVDETSDRELAGASAKFIRAGTGDRVVVAILAVRHDHVFVIDAESEPAGAPSARRAFDTVVGSFRWMN